MRIAATIAMLAGAMCGPLCAHRGLEEHSCAAQLLLAVRETTIRTVETLAMHVFGADPRLPEIWPAGQLILRMSKVACIPIPASIHHVVFAQLRLLELSDEK